MQSDCAVIVTRQQIPSLYTFTVPLACKVKKTVKMPYTVCPLFIKYHQECRRRYHTGKTIVHVPSEIYFTHAVVYITFDSVHFNLDEPAEPPSIMFTFLRSSHSCQWLLVYLWSKQRYSLPTKKLKYFHVLIKSSIKC